MARKIEYLDVKKFQKSQFIFDSDSRYNETRKIYEKKK